MFIMNLFLIKEVKIIIKIGKKIFKKIVTIFNIFVFYYKTFKIENAFS